MADDWRFAYLVPHVQLKAPIENAYVALVPYEDERLRLLAGKRPAVAALTSRFTGQFGQKMKPSALLVRSGSSVDFYAVASFRNVVAIGAVINGWCVALAGGARDFSLWADYFDFYSFTATTGGDQLIAQSVASLEINKPKNFSGQPAAHLPHPDGISVVVDEEVVEGCLQQWHGRFVEKRDEWRLQVLFRSLEIAYQACRVPAVGTRTATIHDAGVGIALWVSALEILSHPQTTNATSATVLALLSQARWLDRRLRGRWYALKDGKGKAVDRLNYVCKLYAELYRARNDFLHGNPVTAANLFPLKDSKGPLLLHCAPLIYRAALMSFLPAPSSATGNKNPEAEAGPLLVKLMRQRRYERAVVACQEKGKKSEPHS